jgi:hypothetical protein
MAISGDIFKINQVYELIQNETWPNSITQPEYGWFIGGRSGDNQPVQSTIDRIIFANDTITAVLRGPLNRVSAAMATVRNSTDAWIAAGVQNAGPSNPSNGSTSQISRMNFANDSSTAVEKSGIYLGLNRVSGNGNDDYGWFAGGTTTRIGTSVPALSTYSRIYRLTYSTDTSNTEIRGPLTKTTWGMGSTGIVDYGWWAGGQIGPGPKVSTIERTTYSTDTSAATARSKLTMSKTLVAGTGNKNYGWYMSGTGEWYDPGPTTIPKVDRLTYSNDTVTTTQRGNLSTFYTSSGVSACSNDGYGYVNGGFLFSRITRIDFANDTNVSSNRGTRTVSLWHPGATDSVVDW